MKKEIKRSVIVAILALGLLAAPAFAQKSHNTDTTQPQQINGNMMSNNQGGGMMGGKQGGNMMGGKQGGNMMGGKQGGNMMGGNQKGGMMGGGMMGGMMGCNGMMGGMMRGMMGGGMMGGNGMMGGGMMGGGMMGGNGMMGGAMMNRMTSDQQQMFMNQTTDMRKKMMDLRFDYTEAMRNPDTSPKDLAEIEKKMLELRSEMMGKVEKMPAK